VEGCFVRARSRKRNPVAGQFEARMKIILDWLTYVAVSCLTILVWVAFF